VINSTTIFDQLTDTYILYVVIILNGTSLYPYSYNATCHLFKI